MRVLVTGATGLVGCHAAVQLLEAGYTVRALVRSPEKIDGALSPLGASEEDVEIVVGDVRRRVDVARALEGCVGACHAAGLFSADLSDAARMRDVNVEGTRIVLEEASRAGLSQTVFVSSILALFPPRGKVLSADDSVSKPSSVYASTKAAADRIARARHGAGDPVTIVYPSACQGPADPTFSVGPQLVATALRSGRVLVTEGGLPYTDVRDLARLIVAIFERTDPPPRIMAPAFFLTHDDYHGLLSKLTGRALRAQRVPGGVLRGLGRLGDLAQRLGVDLQLTREAAEVLTRSVPVDDGVAREMLGSEVRSEAESFRDLLDWMHESGIVTAEQIGRGV
jgi:dihydroflavonol-4-reductase